MDILIFKTNVTEMQEVDRVGTLLAEPGIIKWNFDLEDCDRILRIVSNDISPRHIEEVLLGSGIYCCELLD